MKIIRYYRDCPDFAKNAVIALGNFDGVHLGHKAVIGKTIEIAKKSGLSSAVLTFEPHPATVLFPNDAKNLRITPFHNKAELLSEIGVDLLFPIHFTKEFSKTPAKDFIEGILVKSLKANHLVVGHDFVFGHNRGGNIELLKEYAGKHGYKITQLNAVSGKENNVYSSTGVRKLILEGKIAEAEAILGHQFMIEGKVVKGHGRAAIIGIKTANIALNDYIRPAFGVYFAETFIEGDNKAYPSVINIGNRPTFGNSEDLLETHIFDFNRDIYGKRICVRPLKFLRREEKFPDINSLIEKIKEDCEHARNYFKKA